MAAFAVVLTGFGPSYYFGAFTGAPVLASLVHFHAALYSVWMIVFAVQVSLVAGSRVALHRKLGTLSVALAMVMVLVAWLRLSFRRDSCWLAHSTTG